MIKLALVDDHVILRQSLAKLIQLMDGFEVIFQADNGKQCIDQLQAHSIPDIILLDITMPVMDGIQTARWLQENHPQIKIIALSMLRNDVTVAQMLKHGASGYILKDCEPRELEQALHNAYTNNYHYNELVTHKTIKHSAEAEVLNERELLFLKWACTDLTHKEIAEEMKVSPRTIDGYRDSLFRKLNVNSRVGIAMYALRNGIVQLS